jgi:hypothetical protein
MNPLPFNGPLFIADFVRALDEVQRLKHSRPHYNEKRWFRCLAEADSHDSARAAQAKYDARDAQAYAASHVRYCEHLPGDSIARMNGKVLHLSPSEPEIRTLARINAAQS